MDPNETTLPPRYINRMEHNMKELLQMPLNYLGIDDGVSMKHLGMVMELCRFGEMAVVSPEAVTKVIKTATIPTTEMEGEIPVTGSKEIKLTTYLFGAPTRFGSPIELVCIRDHDPAYKENDINYSIVFMVKDAIYIGGENVQIDMTSLDAEDYIWLLNNKIFSKVQTMADALNTLLEGEFGFLQNKLSPYETDSQEEGFDMLEAEYLSATSESRGLYPAYYAKMGQQTIEDKKEDEGE